MNTRIRQDELIRLLRRRGSTTVAHLTESLEVSRRTALRDIAELRGQGFVIRTSSGPGGGVYLDPTSILVSPKLSSSEVFALLISFAVLKDARSIPFFHLADAGLKKIEQSLPRDRVLELREILQGVYIGQSRPEIPPPIVQEIDASVLPAFETCFLDSQRMQFSYTDLNGNKTKRLADPHGILVLTPAWYMMGYDPDKAAFRHFRMDRIGSATALDETFHRRTLTLEEGVVCPFTAVSFN
jgi:predicted DNA-binding transcriptional regulator YafY